MVTHYKKREAITTKAIGCVVSATGFRTNYTVFCNYIDIEQDLNQIFLLILRCEFCSKTVIDYVLLRKETAMAIQIAVASKHGVAVDEHFGHAKLFFIYALHETGVQLVEQRHVDHYCLGGHGDRSALQKILDTIGDCEAVFVAKVGDGPADKLRARGVEPVTDYPWEEIVPAITDWAATRATGMS